MGSYLVFLTETWQGNILLISLLHFVTWCYCLTLKGWCSDDIEGIAKFSDRFVQEKDPQGRLVKEYKIDSYEVEHGGKKFNVKNTGWNPAIEFPGCFLRWFRLNLGKKFQNIGIDSKGHPIYGFVQKAWKHHTFNVTLQLINLVLGYNLLNFLFGQELAFTTILLFSIHPGAVQTVGWISGINYIFCLFGALVTFNTAVFISNPHIYFPITALASAISCLTLLPGCFNGLILILLGKGNQAVVALIIGILVLTRQGREVVNFRVKAFKEQQMGKSTLINWRKSIVMVKTFWYYLKLLVWPKRLGLFHIWGYHFEEHIEHINSEFWMGFISLIGYGFALWLSPFPVQFGLIWVLIYLLVFSNFITAQQFVSERYSFISSFGYTLIVAYFVKDYPVIVSFLVGLGLMRIWVHLPTFNNEVRFYESNCFNFPNSEVAMGNLGVSYLNHGMPHKALDTWLEASRQNPLYDVPWYNLYSLAKQNGDIFNARNYLQKCLNAKVIHFPDMWKKELADLDAIITQAITDGKIKLVNQPI